MRRYVLLAALATTGHALQAATVTLSLARTVEPGHATLQLRRIDKVDDLKKAPDLVQDIDLANGLPSLELDRGHWSVTLAAEHLWHAPQYFTVGEPANVVLDVWPRSDVTGRLAWPKTRPAQLTMRFEAAANDAPGGEVTCPVDSEAGFRCALPAGVLHLRASVRRHIAHYFWDLRLVAGATRDFGTLRLREGQSITGRIELPRSARGEEVRVVVRAEPAGAIDGERPMIRGGTMLPITATMEKNGFFRIDGVTPGMWIVRAKHPRRLHSAPVTVAAIDGADAHIIAPLKLDRPHAVAIQIEPPLDPAGHPWSVALAREARPGYVEPMLQSDARTDGAWSSKPLLPGPYHVSVLSSSGDEWHYEDVTVGMEDILLRVHLSSRKVDGRILFGDKPLQARLEFSNDAGRTSTTTSGDDGTFSVILPDQATKEWEVYVVSEQPAVERGVTGVQVSDSGTLRIELPDTTLRGEVIDEEGHAVPHPTVRILSGEGRSVTQPTGTEAGTFAISGLPLGPLRVQALAPGNLESDPITVTIARNVDPEPVTLVVRRQKSVHGIVVSDFGPVAGARVSASGTDVPPGVTYFRTSDGRGHFTTSIPPDAREFDIRVNSPGFSYTIDHVRYRDSLLEVRVDQAGGTLVIGSDRDPSQFRVVHGGAILPVHVIARETNGSITERQAVLPRLEPGPYSVCIVADEHWPNFRASNGAQGGRCVSGVVPPHGTLTLDLSVGHH